MGSATEASVALRSAWESRDYPRAAAIASSYARECPDASVAASFTRAAALAKRYDAVRSELRAGLVHTPGCGRPILEPSDPASSEARCNMLCEPDRPRANHSHNDPDTPDEEDGTATATLHSESDTRSDQPKENKESTHHNSVTVNSCCLSVALVRALFGGR